MNNWPEKISEFIEYQDSNSGQLFLRYGNSSRGMSVKLVNSLLDDHIVYLVEFNLLDALLEN